MIPNLNQVDDHFVQLQVIYEDLPDLVELSVRVIHGEWSAASTVYTSPTFPFEMGTDLLRWIANPWEPLRVEAGADTGVGWLAMQFYTVNRAGHARCAVALTSKTPTYRNRPQEKSRFELELPTELGLIERFARECIEPGKAFKGEVRLIGLPT